MLLTSKEIKVGTRAIKTTWSREMTRHLMPKNHWRRMAIEKILSLV